MDLIALYKALGGGWELTYPDVRAVDPPTLVPAAPTVAAALTPPNDITAGADRPAGRGTIDDRRAGTGQEAAARSTRNAAANSALV